MKVYVFFVLAMIVFFSFAFSENDQNELKFNQDCSNDNVVVNLKSKFQSDSDMVSLANFSTGNKSTITRNPFSFVSILFKAVSDWLLGDSSPLKDDPVASTVLGTMTGAFSQAAGAIGGQVDQERKDRRSLINNDNIYSEKTIELLNHMCVVLESKGADAFKEKSFLEDLSKFADLYGSIEKSNE